MLPGRRLTILVIPEEGDGTYEYKIPRVLLWVGLVSSVLVVVLLAVGGRAWFQARQLASQVESLQRDKDHLTEEVALIDDLEVMLRQLEESNRQLRSITAEAVGLDLRTPRERNGRQPLKVVPLSDRLRFGNLRTVPTQAPVAGATWIATEVGVLFPAPKGTLVVAAGAGRVESTAYDPSTGYTVLVDHRNGVATTYAGLGWLVVEPGSFVQKGQPLGLTGRPRDGSIPGVHFGVVEDGREVSRSLSVLWL